VHGRTFTPSEARAVLQYKFNYSRSGVLTTKTPHVHTPHSSIPIEKKKTCVPPGLEQGDIRLGENGLPVTEGISYPGLGPSIVAVHCTYIVPVLVLTVNESAAGLCLCLCPWGA
jgi:hypothetical protein